MAKARKKVEPKRQQEKWEKNGERLLAIPDSFIYEVEVYISRPRSFNLEDTKLVKSNELLKPGRRIDLKGKVRILQDYRLVGATREWLKENNFKQVEECLD